MRQLQWNNTFPFNALYLINIDANSIVYQMHICMLVISFTILVTASIAVKISYHNFPDSCLKPNWCDQHEANLSCNAFNLTIATEYDAIEQTAQINEKPSAGIICRSPENDNSFILVVHVCIFFFGACFANVEPISDSRTLQLLSSYFIAIAVVYKLIRMWTIYICPSEGWGDLRLTISWAQSVCRSNSITWCTRYT